MEIKMTHVSAIKPYHRNPRNNASSISEVAESIKKFGFRQPIVVDSDGVIIVGHTRFQAALSLGLDEVPVETAEDLTEQQVKEYRLADNKVAEGSSWNKDLLRMEVSDLEEANITPLGFDVKEVEALLKEPEEEKAEEEYGGATALSRGSAPLRFYREMDLLEGDVIDYGCGKEEHEFAKYDMRTQPDTTVLLRQYDTVMCNYVLNVQPSDHLIDLILVNLWHLCKDDGKILIAVVSEASLANTAATGHRKHKTPKQWKEILSRFFSVQEMDSTFTGFICNK